MALLPAGKHHRVLAERGPDLLCQKTLTIEERKRPPSASEPPPLACICFPAQHTGSLCFSPVPGPQGTVTHCVGPYPACLLLFHILSPLASPPILLLGTSGKSDLDKTGHKEEETGVDPGEASRWGYSSHPPKEDSCNPPIHRNSQTVPCHLWPWPLQFILYANSRAVFLWFHTHHDTNLCDSYSLHETSQLLGITLPTFQSLLAICLLSLFSWHMFLCFSSLPATTPHSMQHKHTDTTHTHGHVSECVWTTFSFLSILTYPLPLCLMCSLPKWLPLIVPDSVLIPIYLLQADFLDLLLFSSTAPYVSHYQNTYYLCYNSLYLPNMNLLCCAIKFLKKG